MVVLGVENEQELLEWERNLTDRKSLFREPDIGGQATSLAVLPDGDSRPFKRLKLLV